MHVDDDYEESEVLNKKSSPLALKPSLSSTKPPSIFSVSSILADKKTKKRTLQNGGGGWSSAQAQKGVEREEDEITPAELAASRPFFYPALTLDMLNKNRLQVSVQQRTKMEGIGCVSCSRPRNLVRSYKI